MLADDRPICTKEAARFLGLSHRTLEQWRCHGKGPPYIKVGQSVKYLLADLKAFLRQGWIDPNQATA